MVFIYGRRGGPIGILPYLSPHRSWIRKCERCERFGKALVAHIFPKAKMIKYLRINLEICKEDKNFFTKLITLDETSVYHYYPQAKTL